jgi:site-specific recombinase XerD
MVRSFVCSLTDRRASWSWISSNISALRTMFDKFGGLSVTTGLLTPKRPQRLPYVLSRNEAESLIASASSLRDQLLLGLMYRCGLKVGEVCALRWDDIYLDKNVIRVQYARGTKVRTVPIPGQHRELLKIGHEQCPGTDYIFRGKRVGEHLSPRMAQIILGKALSRTEIYKPVTCMTLRHSFAVAALGDGMHIRQLQQTLGHASVETTLLYEHCTPPPNVPNPSSEIRQPLSPQTESVSSSPAAHGPAGPVSLVPFPPDTTPMVEQLYGFLKLHTRNNFLAIQQPSARPRPRPTAEALWAAFCADLARRRAAAR